MLTFTIIMGWLGIIIYLTIIFTFHKMMQHNEFALLHLLMAFMYSLWLPLPLALYQQLSWDPLQIGTIFGFSFLIMLIMTMTFQTGHIVYLTKQNEDQSISHKHGNYLMAMLTDPFEGLIGMLKSVWAIFLSIAFWMNDEFLMAGLMMLFSLLFIYYFSIVLNTTLVKKVKLFSLVKPHPYITNIETLIFFIVLIGYLTLQS